MAASFLVMLQRCIPKPVKYQRLKFFAKILNPLIHNVPNGQTHFRQGFEDPSDVMIFGE